MQNCLSKSFWPDLSLRIDEISSRPNQAYFNILNFLVLFIAISYNVKWRKKFVISNFVKFIKVRSMSDHTDE